MIYVGLQRVPSEYTVHANRFLYFLNILLKKVVTEIPKHVFLFARYSQKIHTRTAKLETF